VQFYERKLFNYSVFTRKARKVTSAMLSRVRRPLSEIPVAHCDHPEMTKTPAKFEDQSPTLCGVSAALHLVGAAIPPPTWFKMRWCFTACSVVSWNANPNS